MRRVKRTIRRPGPVGANLKRLRDQRDMSQRALAEKAGVHPITISKLETGVSQDADLSTIRALAGALGVHDSDITGTLAHSPAPLVDEYVQSPWASIDKPTVEELHWLRSLPGIVFRGVAPTAEAVHHLLLARRAR